MITRERLEQLFICKPFTGEFLNRVTRGRAREGDRAGHLDVHGYRRIVVDYIKYYEHHLMWFYFHGFWPDEVDHVDGDGTYNAITNLRKATRSQNNFNSERSTGTSGLRGAYLDDRVHKWYSKIQLNGQVKWLGHFDSAEEAHLAFMAAVEKYHGKFAFHKRPTKAIRRI